MKVVDPNWLRNWKAWKLERPLLLILEVRKAARPSGRTRTDVVCGWRCFSDL